MPDTVGTVADQPALAPPRHHGSAVERQPDAAPTRGHPAPLAVRPATGGPGDGAGGPGSGADGPAGTSLTERVRAAAADLAPLVAQAEAVRAERARSQTWPRWTDVFTTQFTEFSNRPR